MSTASITSGTIDTTALTSINSVNSHMWMGTATSYPINVTASTAATAYSGIYSAAGIYPGGAGGGGGFSEAVQHRELTSGEIARLSRQMATIYPEDKTLLVCVDSWWSDWQIEGMRVALNHEERKAMIIRTPKAMTLVTDTGESSETQRLDILTRIGVIWEKNPGMTLAMIIDCLFGADRGAGDETLISALELAWG